MCFSHRLKPTPPLITSERELNESSLASLLPWARFRSCCLHYAVMLKRIPFSSRLQIRTSSSSSSFFHLAPKEEAEWKGMLIKEEEKAKLLPLLAQSIILGVSFSLILIRHNLLLLLLLQPTNISRKEGYDALSPPPPPSPTFAPTRPKNFFGLPILLSSCGCVARGRPPTGEGSFERGRREGKNFLNSFGGVRTRRRRNSFFGACSKTQLLLSLSLRSEAAVSSN